METLSLARVELQRKRESSGIGSVERRESSLVEDAAAERVCRDLVDFGISEPTSIGAGESSESCGGERSTAGQQIQHGEDPLRRVTAMPSRKAFSPQLSTIYE